MTTQYEAIQIPDEFEAETNGGFQVKVRIEPEDKDKLCRIYIFHNNESVMAMFANRRKRPTTLYEKEILPLLRERFGIPAEVKIHWSKKAGCSTCPCSPGYIIKDKTFPNSEVYVDITGAPRTEYLLPGYPESAPAWIDGQYPVGSIVLPYKKSQP